jgi:phytol kinase
MSDFLTNLEADLIIFLGALIYVALVILIPKTLQHKGILSSFVARKTIHALAGLAVFVAPYMHYPILAVFLALGSTIITKRSSDKSRTKMLRELYEAISEDEEKQLGYLQGPFAYSIAITVLTFVFIFPPLPTKYYFPIAAILIMMYADTMAAVIGRRYGKHIINIPFIHNKRTVEGSLAFFITSLICCYFTFLIVGQLYPGNSTPLSTINIIIFTVVMSSIATLMELVSPSKYDDLMVPLITTALICIIAILINAW